MFVGILDTLVRFSYSLKYHKVQFEVLGSVHMEVNKPKAAKFFDCKLYKNHQMVDCEW